MKTLLLLLFLGAPILAAAAVLLDPGTVQYTRDEHYIYTKVPVGVTFNREQTEALKLGRLRIIDQLTELRATNPRGGFRSKLIRLAEMESVNFEKGLDDMLDFAQKNYGTITPMGWHLFNALPTGIVLFSGFEVGAGFVVSAGGSVMIGLVLVPLHVTRINIDTNEVTQYTEWDSNLVVWPSANAGVGVNGGANFRAGGGLIWGALARAQDFSGLVLGSSVTVDLGFGLNAKIQVLKNWSKPGAINNAFITVGAEIGPAAGIEAHANVSYLIDAATYLKTGGAVVKKVTGLAPPEG